MRKFFRPVFILFSFFFLFGTTFSANINTDWILDGSDPPANLDTPKERGSIYEANEFNAIIKTLYKINNDDGNIGLGTVAPSQRLDIAGDIRIRGLNGEGSRVLCANSQGVLESCSNSTLPTCENENEILKWNVSDEKWECGNDATGEGITLPVCSVGQIIYWNEDLEDWSCGDLTDTISPCENPNNIIVWDGLEWICLDIPVSPSVECAEGEILKWMDSDGDGGAPFQWVCAEDIDTNSDTHLYEGELCADQEILKWNSENQTWTCQTDDTGVGTIPNCTDEGDVLVRLNNEWICSSIENAMISCSEENQILKWNNTDSIWQCGDDLDTDTTIADDLVCENNSVLKWNDEIWTCAEDINTDTDTTLADNLSCESGEVLKWDGNDWMCSSDLDTLKTHNQSQCNDEDILVWNESLNNNEGAWECSELEKNTNDWMSFSLLCPEGEFMKGIEPNPEYNSDDPMSVDNHPLLAFCQNFHIPELLCSDGIDNNQNGDTDCADADCREKPFCHCSNGILDDDLGEIHIDCGGECSSCSESNDEYCSNGIDDDEDGSTDCEDTGCSNTSVCPEICDDTIDNDADTLIDCDDPECRNFPACKTEICYNGIDDNEDGLTDCEDLQTCGSTAYCLCDAMGNIEYDGRSYNTIGIGNNCWLDQDVPGAYTHSQAMNACPDGFKLPSTSEYNALAYSIGIDTGSPTDVWFHISDAGLIFNAQQYWTTNTTTAYNGDPIAYYLNLGNDIYNTSARDYLYAVKAVHCVNGDNFVGPTCFDGVQNGDETGVDCGGSCPDACPSCMDPVPTENVEQLYPNARLGDTPPIEINTPWQDNYRNACFVDCVDGYKWDENQGTCIPTEICTNDIDDDGDGNIDCFDTECIGQTKCDGDQILTCQGNDVWTVSENCSYGCTQNNQCHNCEVDETLCKIEGTSPNLDHNEYVCTLTDAQQDLGSISYSDPYWYWTKLGTCPNSCMAPNGSPNNQVSDPTCRDGGLYTCNATTYLWDLQESCNYGCIIGGDQCAVCSPNQTSTKTIIQRHFLDPYEQTYTDTSYSISSTCNSTGSLWTPQSCSQNSDCPSNNCVEIVNKENTSPQYIIFKTIPYTPSGYYCAQ